jgi:hypothetical protein
VAELVDRQLDAQAARNVIGPATGWRRTTALASSDWIVDQPPLGRLAAHR